MSHIPPPRRLALVGRGGLDGIGGAAAGVSSKCVSRQFFRYSVNASLLLLGAGNGLVGALGLSGFVQLKLIVMKILFLVGMLLVKTLERISVIGVQHRNQSGAYLFRLRLGAVGF